MKKTALVLCAAVSLTALAYSSPVHAAGPVCGRWDKMTKVLATKYKETRKMVAVTGGNKGVFEVYANDETGSWTALYTTPNSRACIMGAGTNYEAVKPTPKGRLS